MCGVELRRAWTTGREHIGVGIRSHCMASKHQSNAQYYKKLERKHFKSQTGILTG